VALHFLKVIMSGVVLALISAAIFGFQNAAALGVDTTAALNWLDPDLVFYSILNWRV